MTNQPWIETYKSCISLSIEGLKFLALANGGAGVALLAYLGAIASKGMTTPDMRYPMAAFLTGLTFCGFAWVLAYLTQLKLLNEIGKTKEFVFKHTWLLSGAVLFYLCSILAFGYGAWQAVIRF